MKVYTIYVGNNVEKDLAEAHMLKVIEHLRSHNFVISDEALSLEPNLNSYDVSIEAAKYDLEKTDAVMIVHDEHENAKVIIQTTDDGNEITEALRRAFCRLVMRSMHVRKYEVCITVS